MVKDNPELHYALQLADTSLILSHRLSEWCGVAPELEIDMALAISGSTYWVRPATSTNMLPNWRVQVGAKMTLLISAISLAI